MQTSLKQKSRFRSTLLILVLFMFAIMATVVSAATVGVDNFNDAQQVCFPTTVLCPVSESIVSTSNSIGGTRHIMVERVSGGFPVEAQTGFGGDFFSFDGGVASPSNFTLTWDGDNSTVFDPTGLGGIDLTDSGSNDGIYFRDIYSDKAFTLEVEIYTNANEWSVGTLAVPITAPSFSNLDIPFASFTQGGGASGPAILTNVGAIRVKNQSAIADLQFIMDYFAADSVTPTAVTFSNTNTTTPVNTNNAMPLAAVILFGLTGLAIYQFRRQEN